MSKIQVLTVTDRGNGMLKITCFVKYWWRSSRIKSYVGYPGNWLTADLEEIPSRRVEKELNLVYNEHYEKKREGNEA